MADGGKECRVVQPGIEDRESAIEELRWRIGVELE